MPAPTARSHPVLVDEDDPDIREAVQQLLEAEGYPVEVAANGAEALDRLHRGTRPGLILLDLMMPVMDGWQFCREREKEPDLASIPLVVLSAVSRRDPRNACTRAVDYLGKPLDIDALLSTIERHASDAR